MTIARLRRTLGPVVDEERMEPGRRSNALRAQHGRGTDILLGGNPEFLARFDVKLAELDVSHPELPQGERKLKAVEAAAIPGRVDENTNEYRAALEKYRAECAAEKKQVVAAGGLHIIGTERHESRRSGIQSIGTELRGDVSLRF